MNAKLGIPLLLSACLAGCAHRLSYSELTSKIERTERPSIYYKGSDSDAHYFDFLPLAGVLIGIPRPRARSIELSSSSAVVKDPFPLTEDESKWRRYALFLPSQKERFYEDVRPVTVGNFTTRAQHDSGLNGLQP